MRELLDRSPCSNTSRNSERKRGRGRSMEIEWFHGEVTRAIWRPAKELPRIKSVRILPEASNRGIHERGQRLLVEGEGRRKRRREEKKEKERNTQIKQPFLFVSPFWSEKTPISGRCVIDEIEEVLFAIFFGFWSSILIRRLETEKSLLKCFGIIKQSGRIAFVWL